MKKLLSLLLCVALLCVMIPGCESAPDIDSIEDITDEPLRLCVDFGDRIPPSAEEQVLSSINSLEMYYKAGYGGAEKIELELIPKGSVERNTALTRIRTEIMAGGGPDVFIAVCPDFSAHIQGLFPYPEKAMAMGYFLPLDAYIEKTTQFMEWNKLEPTIMDAGKYDGQQMILPMAFDLPVTYYHQDEVSGYDGSTTWADMVETDDPALAAAASLVIDGDDLLLDEVWFPSVFGEYVDYEADSLRITEEELLQRVLEVKKIVKGNDTARKAPVHHSSPLTEDMFFTAHTRMGRPINQIGDYADMTMVPIYNTDDGTTAFIKAYCAVNANTVQPKNAFFAADYFLSEGVQKQSGTCEWLRAYSAMTDIEYLKKRLTDSRGEELERVFDQISCVRCKTPLDTELSALIVDVVFRAANNEEVKEYVSEAYTKMQMMLAES